MKNFITPNDVHQRLDSVIVLDARGFSAYAQGHIPGAYAIDMDAHMSGPVGLHGGRHPLPDMDVFANRLAQCGVSKGSSIVVYDGWLSLSGRLWWMLRYMGFEDVKVLAGGIERWYREGYPMTKEETPLVLNPRPLEYTLRADMVMDREAVLRASESGSHVIIDARSPERYSGSVPDVMDGMTGHVPGAINHFYEAGFTAEGIREHHELELLFADVRQSQKPMVAYCGSGVTACNLMLTLDEVGVEPALYVGSSSDWMTYADAPLATGVETLEP